MISIRTPTDFATALLEAIGAPATPVNLTTVTQWETAEGGNWRNTAAFNPLNTTLKVPGSTVLPGGGPAAGAGVQAYQSWDQGLAATVQTLQGSAYSKIVADLRASAPTTQVAADIGSSPWGTPNWTGSGAGTSASASTGTSANVTAGGGQGGAPYSPSIVPGIPGSPPTFPDFTSNPYNELSRVLSWTTEFGGWALFTAIVFLFGLVLLLIGLAILAVVLFGPVADVAIGATALGKIRKTVSGRRAEGAHQARRAERATDAEHRAATARYRATRPRAEPGPGDRTRSGDRAQAGRSRFDLRPGEEPF